MQRPKGKKEVRPKCQNAPDGAILAEVEAQKIEKIEARLKKKEDLNILYKHPKDEGRKVAAIHLAVEIGVEEIVEALANGGAQVDVVDSQGATPLVYALTPDEPKQTIIDILLKYQPDVNISGPGGSPVHMVATKGDEELLMKLLDMGNEASCICAMQAAARSANLGMIQMLLSRSATLESQDAAGLTPLMLLLSNGHKEVAEELLKQCDPEKPPILDLQEQEKGWTALMFACDIGSQTVVSLLLQLGASVDVVDSVCGNTVVHNCIKGKQWEVSKELAMRLSQVDVKNKDGETPFSLAMQADEDELMEILLSRGADCGGKCEELLKKAVEKKQDGVTAELIKACQPGVLEALQIDRQSLLTAGMGKAAVAHIEKLEGPEILSDSPIDADGNTYLHDAAKDGSFSFAEALIKRGLNPNKANANGDTPLHVAAKSGNVPVCKALIEGGADVMARNAKNRTPRSQIKLPQATKDYLLDAEEDAKEKKKLKASLLWDSKMKATQTESAFGLRVV